LHDLGFSIVGKQSDRDVYSRPAFVPGEVYHRRALHDLYGGQRQGGISTPKDHPIIFLVTGESGTQYGYTDGFRQDGTFWYTGDGQVGDMQLLRGNAAILNHQSHGKALHLFQGVQHGELQYTGEATYVGHHMEVAPDRDGMPRQAIVFELSVNVGANGIAPKSVEKPRSREQPSPWRQPLDSLRKLALEEAPGVATAKTQRSVVRNRSDAVRVYVLRRANGVCEGCGEPAPFDTVAGRPYLEPHHTRRLADGGPDHPRWVGALCPNCHTRIHYGADGEDFNRRLIERLATLESRY
jgi:5-methylcytosine-specific restriction protein A